MDILKNEYENEPVFYCKNCLSLSIIGEDGVDFCDKCGCTEIETTDIMNWRTLYHKKYKRNF